MNARMTFITRSMSRQLDHQNTKGAITYFFQNRVLTTGGIIWRYLIMLKYENWRELARSCQESGMSVNGWSKRNNIPTTTCRQWLVRLEKEERALKNTDHGAELSVWGKVGLEQSGPAHALDSDLFPSSIQLSYHDWNIEVKGNFDPILLSQVIKVVDTIC